jgi:LacI family transcriptional regulator
VANRRGYDVLIFQTHETYDREIANLRQALARRVDGVLISLSSETSDVTHLQELQQQGTPIVQFDRVSAEVNTPRVVADNFGGAFAATEHLIKTGRRRIAHLTIQPWLSITQERLAGYRAALEQNGLSYDESRPDAFFTASDRLALGCLAALRQRRIHIPDDVSLIGFTNLNVADLLSPSMSTVVQPAMEIGQTAAERLLDLIERKQRPALPITTTTILTSMQLRESTLLPVVA